MAKPAKQRLLPRTGVKGFLFFREYRYEKMWGRCGANRAKNKKEVSSFRLNLLFLMVELNGIEPLAS